MKIYLLFRKNISQKNFFPPSLARNDVTPLPLLNPLTNTDHHHNLSIITKPPKTQVSPLCCVSHHWPLPKCQPSNRTCFPTISKTTTNNLTLRPNVHFYLYPHHLTYWPDLPHFSVGHHSPLPQNQAILPSHHLTPLYPPPHLISMTTTDHHPGLHSPSLITTSS